MIPRSSTRPYILRLLDTASLGFFVTIPIFAIHFLLRTVPRNLPLDDGLLYIGWASFVMLSLHLWTFRDLLLKIERTMWLGAVGFAALVLAGAVLCHPSRAADAGDRMGQILHPLAPFFRLRAGGIATMLVGFFWFSFCAVAIPFVRLLRQETPPGSYPRADIRPG